jgi:hypothetical protein
MFKTAITKKIVCVLLSALLYFVIEGCGGGSGTSAGYTSSSAANGTATLSWNAVTTYTDNSTFTPAGYKVYYGTAHNTYTTVVDIPVANLVSHNAPAYTIKNLSQGTCYIAVSVYDVSATESALSTEVSKVIH